MTGAIRTVSAHWAQKPAAQTARAVGAPALAAETMPGRHDRATVARKVRGAAPYAEPAPARTPRGAAAYPAAAQLIGQVFAQHWRERDTLRRARAAAQAYAAARVPAPAGSETAV